MCWFPIATMTSVCPEHSSSVWATAGDARRRYLPRRCRRECDRGVAEDALDRRDRIGAELALADAWDPEQAFPPQRTQHQPPLVLCRRLLVGVVVDRDLEYRPARVVRVDLPASALVEERGIKATLREAGGDERGNVAAVETVTGVRVER